MEVTNESEIYEFSERHVTGGTTIVRITRDQILDYVHRFGEFPGRSEQSLIDEFCAVYEAHKIEGGDTA